MALPPSRWFSVVASHTSTAAAIFGCGATLLALTFASESTRDDDDEPDRDILNDDNTRTAYTTDTVAAAAPMMPVTVFRPHPDMEVAFDARTRNPVYSLERLPPQHERTPPNSFADANRQRLGKARQGMNFHEEKTLPPSHRSRNSYYKHSGFDRGHLIPASDFRGDRDAVSCTFNLCNVSPQYPQFNRRVWSRLEALIRSVALEEWDGGRRRSTYVVSGPIWLPSSIAGGKRNAGSRKPLFQFTHLAIGQPPSLVHVPTHFFKIVAVVHDDDERLEKIATFVVPNQEPVVAGTENIDLQRYLVRISDVEAVTGMAFFPKYLGPKSSDEVGSSFKNHEDIVDLRSLADALTDDVCDSFGSSSSSKDMDMAMMTPSTDIVPFASITTTTQKRKKEFLAEASNVSLRHLCDDKRCSVIVKATKARA